MGTLPDKEAPSSQETAVPRELFDAEVLNVGLEVAASSVPGKLIKFVQWLRQAAEADIKEIRESARGDTIIELSFEHPTPLFQMLSELPDVGEVTEAVRPVDLGDPSTLRGRAGRPSMLYRLTLKAD